jgi:hypothetical protein
MTACTGFYNSLILKSKNQKANGKKPLLFDFCSLLFPFFKFAVSGGSDPT